MHIELRQLGVYHGRLWIRTIPRSRRVLGVQVFESSLLVVGSRAGQLSTWPNRAARWDGVWRKRGSRRQGGSCAGQQYRWCWWQSWKGYQRVLSTDGARHRCGRASRTEVI